MTTFSTYATATFADGNIVVVQSAENMIPGLPITFLGNTFGNVTANATYYIGNITFGFPTSNITITSLPGGAIYPVSNGSGNMVTSFSQGGQQIIPTVPPGEPLNVAFDAINVNFDQIWAAGPVGTNIQIDQNTIYTLDTNGNLVLNPNGIGNVIANAHVIPDQDRVRNLGSPLLRWNTVYAQNIVGNISGNVDAGGSNTQVQFNNNDFLAGSPGFTFDKNTNAVEVTGTVTAGNVLTSGIVSSSGGVYGDIYTTMIDSGDSSAILILSEVNMLADLDVSGQISATGNVFANYYFGNGSQLTGIIADNVNADDLIGNILSGNVIYSNLITVGDLISLSVVGNTTTGNLDTAGSISASGNVTGGNILFGSGIVSGTGNIYANKIFANIQGNIDAAGNLYEVQFNTTGDQLGASSNFTYDFDNNVLTIANGNIVSGNVSATGNISATYFFGNGSQLTGIDATSIQNGNSNVRVAANANVTVGVSGVSNIAVFTTDGVDIAGNVSATGNVQASNFFFGAGIVSGTGNIYADKIFANIQGNIDAAGNLYEIQFNTTGDQLGANANFTYDSANNVLTVNNGNIVGGNILTSGLVSASANVYGSWFVGNVDAETVTALSNITGGNILTAGQVSATGSLTGGNIFTGGAISAQGNVTGNYFIGNGAFLTGIDTTLISNGNTNVQTYANGNVAITVAGVANTVVFTVSSTEITGNANVTGTVTGGNITTAGEVSAAGNVSGANVNTTTIYSSSDLFLNPTGNVVLGGGKYINNVNNPQQAQDAATKQYVDDAVSAGIHIHTPVYLETPVALPSATYAQGGNTYTVNQTIAGNTVVFSTAANLQPNDQLWFSNSFEGIIGNTAYFVVSAPNTSSAVLSTAYNGVPVSNITANTGLTQTVLVNSGVGATLTGTANGALSVDSVAVSVTNRILVYNQANAYENGVYVVTQTGNATTPFILTRSSDTDRYVPDDNAGLDQGSYFYVQAGATGAGESYVMTGPAGPFVIGLANIEFTQFSASQVYSPNIAAGLSLTGTVFSAKVDNDTTAFDGNGNIIVKAGANLTTPNIGAATGSSLSVTGNVTGGNIVTPGSVTATGNITGNYFIGNGSQLTDVTASSVDAGNITGNTLSSNVLFSSLTTVGTLTSLSVAGNIDGGNIATAGIVTATGNVTGGNLVTSGTLTATGSMTGGNVFTNGIISATGDVTGGNLITSGLLTATGNITGGNVLTNGIISATGDVTGGNIVTTGSLTATGNITGGNIVTAGQITATGNITAPTFLGNLEGTIASLSGNVIGGNLFTSGIISATGNITGGNIVTDGTVSATGNVTAPTFVGNLEATTVSATANITGGNILFGSGIVSGTGNIYADNIFANISGNIDAAGNLYEIQFNTTGDQLGANANFTYDSANNVFTVATGNIVGGNLLLNNNISATGNITGNNIIVGNILIPSSGNVTLGNVNINDLAEPVANSDAATKFYVDSVAANVLPIISNQTINPDGISNTFVLNQTATDVGILLTINGVTQTPATNYTVTGNSLTMVETPLSSDIIQVRYLSGGTTGGGGTNYANANAVAYGESGWAGNLIPQGNLVYSLGNSTNRWNDLYLSGNTIYLDSATIGANGNDITVSGNVSANYFIGDGSLLTGLSPTYGNANVATFMAAYGSNTISTTGNITGGNVIALGNVVGNVSGFAIGYRDIPQLSLSANTTIATTDAGKHYYSTSASSLILTIANNASQAFAVGATINIINQGTGNITVARDVGVTLYLAGNSTSANRTITSYGVATMTKVATDTWFIVGAGVS